MKRIHDNHVLESRREFINEEIVELRKMIQFARQEGRGRPTGWEEKAIEDRIEKLRIMDEVNVIVFEDESRLQMTRRQIRKNRWLIKKEKAMQRKGRTWDSPWAGWHEERLKDQRTTAALAQMKAENDAAIDAEVAAALADYKAAEAEVAADWRGRSCMSVLSEIDVALADYKQRFIAKHGQAEWDTVSYTHLTLPTKRIV